MFKLTHPKPIFQIFLVLNSHFLYFFIEGRFLLVIEFGPHPTDLLQITQLKLTTSTPILWLSKNETGFFYYIRA